LTSLPVIIIFTKFPYYNFPYLNTHLFINLFWVVPYGLIGIFLLIKATIDEKNPYIKRQRYKVCFIVVPFIAYGFLSAFIIPALEIKHFWNFDIWFVVLMITIFIYLGIREGVLGVRLRIEKDDLLNSMTTINNGVSVFNHAIKNEMILISMCINNIKNNIDTDNLLLDRNIDSILNSTQHLLKFSKSINYYTKEIKLNKKVYNLARIVDTSLLSLQPIIDEKKVKIVKEYSYIFMPLDYIHVKEVIINIIKNSIEATEINPVIYIRCTRNQKLVTLEIEDNGDGISKNDISKIFEPFFTTKKKESNYGVGLSYCYNVIQLHGGSLNVQSKEGKGTTVFINLPQKDIIYNNSCHEQA